MGQRNRAAALVVAVAVVVTFLPAVIVPYGFMDDYMNLAYVERLGLPSPPYAKSLMPAAAAEGRPLFGLLVDPVFSMAGTVDNLRFARLIALLGIVVLALLLYKALVRSRVGQTPAALIALLICTLPPFQLYAAWATTFAVPWAALFAGCASLLTVAAVDGPKRLRLERSIGASLLMIAPLLIYQPAAMFFWVFLAVALVGVVDDAPHAWRLARAHFAIAAVALALAYLGYRLCLWLVSPAAAPFNTERGAVTHDIVGKAEWLAHWGIYASLNLFDLTWSPWLAVIVAAVAAGGIMLWLLRRSKRPLLFIGLALILVPLADLPMLVVAEDVDLLMVRTQASLAALIALYFGLGALAISVTFLEWVEGRVSRRALIACERAMTGLAIAFVATGVVVANRSVDKAIAEPQLRELRLLRHQVAALPDPVERVSFVLSGPDEIQPDSERYDAFGWPATVQWLYAVPLTLLVLREQGRLREPPPVVDTLPWYMSDVPAGRPVVNLNGLIRPPAES
jgi:hypothetical protein